MKPIKAAAEVLSLFLFGLREAAEVPLRKAAASNYVEDGKVAWFSLSDSHGDAVGFATVIRWGESLGNIFLFCPHFFLGQTLSSSKPEAGITESLFPG